MIRLLGHTLKWLLMLGTLAGLVVWLWPMAQTTWLLFDPQGQQNIDPRLAEAAAEAVYVLEKQRWLEFPIVTQGDYLKVVSNANLPAAAAQAGSPETFWIYAIDYQVLDKTGRVLKEGTYHLRTMMSWRQPDGAPFPLTPAFYLNRLSLPASGRVMTIPVRETPGAARLRLRLAQRDAAIDEVVARVYAQEHLLDATRDYRWQRVSRRLRERLARASVYGADLLSLTEQTQLLRQIWSPTAPLGVEGRAYRSQKMYVMFEVEAEPRRLPVLPAGLYVDPNLRGTLAIPEPGGVVELELLDVAPLMAEAGIPSTSPFTRGGDKMTADLSSQKGDGETGRMPATLRLVWYGSLPSQRAEYAISMNGATTRWTGALMPGLVEVIASQPVVVRAALRQETGQAIDLVQEPVYLRLYEVGAGQALEFDIEHVGAQPTFWRVSLRQALPAVADPAIARYELVDEHSVVVRQGALPVPALLSRYDWRVSSSAFFDRISEPASYAFVLPVKVVKARLRAETPLLVAAYTRPPDLPRSVRAPEDYRPDLPGTGSQPFWFPVLPVDAQTLLQEARSGLIVVQSRPPVINPDILAGRYDWQDYTPKGPWRGRYLLNPRDPGTPLRVQALDSVFRPVSAGVPTTLHFQGQPGRSTVDPTLIVLRESAAPSAVRVAVDGVIIHSSVIAVRRASIWLPPLPVGTHTLTVTASQPGRWLISNAGADENSVIRRLAYLLDQQPLEFIYAKTTAGEETLTGVLQGPFAVTERSRLRVRVEIDHAALLGPANRLTAREWRYDLRPDPRQAIPVLDTPNEQVGLGQRFFLPLGDDLPPGSYRIRLQLEQGRGYLSLYRVIPGLPALFELFREETLP
ncbi:MAG: hypothetical protein KDJ31_11715 [Candidatus Competibacteraceae bacterium]|nr:hypothetical protein [Candidatus Competibacteraceae bacterium]